MAAMIVVAVLVCCLGSAAAQGTAFPDHYSVETGATVMCSESGFTPYFNWTHEAGRTWNMNVTIGDHDYGCNGEIDITSGTYEFRGANFDGHSTAEIPYEDASGNVACNGTMDYSGTNNANITYTANVDIIMTETIRTHVQRQQKFEFIMKCTVIRATNVSAAENWTMGTIERTGNEETESGTFDISSFEMKFYTDATYVAEQAATFTVNSAQDVYFMIQEKAKMFRFSTERCWATKAAPADTANPDMFWDDGCPVDKTIAWEYGDAAVDGSTNDTFKMQMQSFFFAGDKAASIYFHCEIMVCHGDETAVCTRKNNEAACPRSGRRRRSFNLPRDLSPWTRDASEEGVERTTLSAEQHIILENSGIYAPICGEGYVYDRIATECVNTRVMEVRGIYFPTMEYISEYADTSSDEFIALAREKSYLLFALFQTTDRKFIRGVKVIAARRGSVIIDVQITYDDTVDEEHVFKEIEAAIKTTTDQQTRVMNVLKIEQSKTIEYVPIMTGQTPAVIDSDKIVLIVVIVVLLLVVCIAAIAFVKRRQAIIQVAPTKTAFDNDN